MRLLEHLVAVGALALCLHASARAATAQSTVTGTVTGSVADPTGVPLPRALVSLVAVPSGGNRQVTVRSDGSFVLGRVTPGTYEVRVEAVGYRPLVARTLSVAGGEVRALSFVLTPAAPPVDAVDSVSLSGGSILRVAGEGVRVDARQMEAYPHRLGDLSWLAALTSTSDASLGTQGLPGDLTALVVDGVPVYRAPHPRVRSELSTAGPFPISALSSVSVLGAPSDVEWAGGAGGHVIASTRAGGGPSGLEIAYSGDPGWSSSELDLETPSLHSLQGGFHGTLGAAESDARVFVSGDVLRHQTPLAPRAADALVGGLTVLTPEVATAHTAPAVETYGRYSGLARADMRRGDSGTLFFRAAGSYERREFEGVGPAALALEAAPDEQSLDLSLVGGILGEYSSRVTLEFRGGFSGSFREFEDASSVPNARLTEAGPVLGATPASEGTSSRTDLLLMPILHFAPSLGRFKFGASVRVSTHTMEHSPWSGGEYAFSDVDAVNGGVGYVQASTAGEVSFSTQEYGIFAQYYATPAPGLQLSLGARYDRERIPADEAVVNEAWLSATGLDNTDAPTRFHELGMRGSLTWDPPAAPGLRVSAVASLDYGDMDTRAVYELLAQETGPTIAHFTGAGTTWPAEALPAAADALPTLTLLGPDTRPPRSTTYGVGISQRLGNVLSFHARGSLRRTDFLMRRRNLNIPVTAVGVDPGGRSIFGTLEKSGALVTATGDDARRFPEFAEVWALDPDGWSEYRGVTVGVDYGASSVGLFGAYTWSRTTDNWIGAARGLVDASLPPILPEADEGTPWAESTSDFDVPHQAAAGATLRFGSAGLTGTYRYRSGLPFTPGYRFGVDANGDGSMRNDVAFVPGDSQLTMLLDAWSCLEDQANAFASRNSCRGPARHALDLGLEVGLGRIGGREATLRLDALNVVEEAGGVVDEALILVDPAAAIMTSTDGATFTIPTTLNPDFGTVLYPSSRGRMLRLGLRIGR